MASPYELSDSLFRLNAHEKDVVGYGVFYGNGESFFGSTLEEWRRAPKENVQLIVLSYKETDEEGNNYRHSICSWDYYAFDGKTFTAGNDTRELCSDYILYGRWMKTEDWKKVVEHALETYTKFKAVR